MPLFFKAREAEHQMQQSVSFTAGTRWGAEKYRVKGIQHHLSVITWQMHKGKCVFVKDHTYAYLNTINSITQLKASQSVQKMAEALKCTLNNSHALDSFYTQHFLKMDVLYHKRNTARG